MLFGHLSIVKEDLKCNRIQIWRTLSTSQNDLLESSWDEDHCCQTMSKDIAQECVPFLKKSYFVKINLLKET